MKKLFLSLICSISIFGGLSPNFVLAQPDMRRNTLPLYYDNFDPILKDNIIHDRIKDNDDEVFEQGTENLLKKIFHRTGDENDLIVKANIVLGAIALVWLIVLGSKFIVARGDEEKLSKYKSEFGWIVLGLVLMSVAEFMAWQVMDPAQDNLLEGISAANFDHQVKLVIRFIEFLILGIALIKMMMAGYDLITGSEEEETISREKEFFRSFFFGAALILMAEVLISILSPSIVDSAGNTLTATQATTLGIREITGLINFVLSFIAVTAVIMLILSSLYYVVSFGSEDQMNRAKRIIIACIIGIMICISSYTLVTFMFK
ncbi:hypothetical protein K9M41_03435 [Candidatus Gracilibacteria bacterium]|nr:hypothetical protein [Candidatus Gracilibacteria bacterium]